ncbi:cell division protein ZapB [Haladaptatus caseinilyticus]|uniref:cell division protein ZapB n=1 Tax=Haladaptatus caseinilyticus TaxID=2993314 RepID=UPI00224B167B|nr:cell division protein ZapB [Haladaptatus caseinilyticus]
MSNTTISEVSSTLDGDNISINELAEHIQLLTGRIDDLEQEVATKDERIDDLEQQVENLEADHNTHDKRMDALGTGIASANDDIAELEDRIDATDSDGSDSNTPADDWTPLERLSIIGDDALDEHVSASDRRAVTLFEHWDEWSTKTPQGNLLKTSDSLKSLLSTATDEHLAWKQVYRACRRVEQLSKGRLTFFQHDKHGWMLKQHRKFSSAQPSSADVTASSVTT